MKKLILSVVAVAAFASYNVYRSNNNETEGMSDTMLANVEALAGGENDLCPNGCLTTKGECYCNGWHMYEEAIWRN